MIRSWGVTRTVKALRLHGRTTLVFINKAVVEDCQLPLLRDAPHSLKCTRRARPYDGGER